MNPSHPPRVLLFTDSDAFAGTERHMLDLALGLRDEAFSASIACPVPGALAHRAAAGDIEVFDVAKRRMPDLPAVLTLRRLLRSKQIDLIHAHNGRCTLLAAAAVRLAGRGTLVATQHFIAPGRSMRGGIGGRLVEALHRRAGRVVARHIAVSDAARDAMISRGDAAADQIDVVPNGLAAPDPAALRPAAEVRADLGVPMDVPLIACVARLEAEKSIQTLIEAVGLLRDGGRDAWCVVAGEGDRRADLEKLLAARGLLHRFQLPGFRNDALSFIASADLFALPSRAEPFGLVLLEAMALGLPVVATAAGGPLEIVETGVTGLLVPPGDPAAMSAALGRLLADPAAAAAMGGAGRDRFAARYTRARMAAATAATYRTAEPSTRERSP